MLLKQVTQSSKIVKRGRGRLRLALNVAFSRGAVSSASGLASKSRGFKSNLDSFAGFAFALKTFNLNIAFIKLNSLIIANRDLMIRSASSMLPFPLALAAFVAPVAFAALVAFVALIIVALFTLIVALAALAAALAVAMTFAERRAKVKRLLKALIDLLL
ncbi:hypothetical protein MBM_09752 [Drepanopeziza brunnea f. sp. 'multigermtubi' MB_m1]|uniref:Uncharacterized protein n=1 Tax=Marssonina brunnea f. sp. multigermtubi (strain MB_m1) TaxID=1072389 RepID=K1W5D6_MARBU|nr:uncharacterized protein MBM_09752 [Drepanopeziza brunnea f. sp. 'multigermtubi' MB_m1]EKD12115.1 hypothetical protein MBM_09752 [Drepanopeziza brunnea f. sp. 'multigermtubi' MB_m1]